MISSQPSLRVLIVEDSPSDVAILHANLDEWVGQDCDIVEAMSLADAQRSLLGGDTVDVVILDLTLPDAQGLDAVAVLRGLQPNLPIVVVTGDVATDLEGAAIRIGADAVVTKECLWSQPHPLGHSVRTAVERHRRAAPSTRQPRPQRPEQPTIALVGLDAADTLAAELVELDPTVVATVHANDEAYLVSSRMAPVPDLVVVGVGQLETMDVRRLGVLLSDGPDCPTVAVSTTDDEERQVAAINLGVDDVLHLDGLGARQLLRSQRFAAGRRRRSQELHAAAHLDELTGLPSRRALFAHLNQVLAPDGPQPSLTLLFLDLDGFKHVNDQWGHLAGDQVLRIVAGRLAATARSTDFLARLGGDEFVVVCQGLDAKAATALTERLKTAVGLPISIDGTLNALLGVSIGAISGVDDQDAVQLLDLADREMYLAKRARGPSMLVVEETPAA